MGLFASYSNACSVIERDVIQLAKRSESISIGLITTASSEEAEKNVNLTFLDIVPYPKRIPLSCGELCTLNQRVRTHIKIVSETTVKGNPQQEYDFRFHSCTNIPTYTLFARVAVFDYGHYAKWRVLTKRDERKLKKYRDKLIITK